MPPPPHTKPENLLKVGLLPVLVTKRMMAENERNI